MNTFPFYEKEGARENRKIYLQEFIASHMLREEARNESVLDLLLYSILFKINLPSFIRVFDGLI